MERNYAKEYARNNEINTHVGFKLDKESFEKFKNKAIAENKTMSDILKECVQEYINK
jgi:hypothetical protein